MNTSPATLQLDDAAETSNRIHASILDLKDLMKEQNMILRQLSQKQNSSTLVESITPITVPSRSTSAWDPLLQSFTNNIRPTIERWRRTLDSTLIFATDHHQVGLFSAIITAFFVESLNSVKLDPQERTNELLVNLTDIMIMLSRSGAETANISEPAPFVPDEDAERFNFYCAISLILSISIAVVAVAGHVFVSSMVRPQGDTINRLTEQHQRWASAKRILGPGIEAIPQVLVVPVAIFTLGLMDRLFCSAIHLPRLSISMLLAAIIATINMAVLAIAAIAALVHGILYSETSPFRISLFKTVCFPCGARRDWSNESELEADKNLIKGLTIANCEVFHQVLQETFDDEWLDHASSALSSIMMDYFRLKSSFLSLAPLSHLELNTLLHLLSAEASLQSNITAATVIAESGVFFYYWDSQNNRMGVDPTQRALLLQALVRASKHALPIGVHSPEWHMKSPFIQAMAFLINYPKAQDSLPHPLLRLLSANALKEPASFALVQAYGEAFSYAILLIKEAIQQALGNPKSFTLLPEAEIDSALLRVLGPPDLEAQDAHDTVLSLIQRPHIKNHDYLSRFNQVNWSSTQDHKIMIAGLARWLSGHPIVPKTVASFVDGTSLQFFESTAENQAFKARNLTLIVLNTLCPDNPSSVALCSAFILKSCTTYAWNTGTNVTLSLISKFLAILVRHMDTRKNDSSIEYDAIRALTMVHRWIKSNFEIGHHLGQMNSLHWDLFTEESILERIERIRAQIEEFPGISIEAEDGSEDQISPEINTIVTGSDVIQ